MSLGLGVIGCGSVFAGPCRGMIAGLHDRVHVSAVYNVDERKRHGAAAHFGFDPGLRSPADVVSHPDVDWAPEGWELWRNAEAAGRIFPESDRAAHDRRSHEGL